MRKRVPCRKRVCQFFNHIFLGWRFVFSWCLLQKLEKSKIKSGQDGLFGLLIFTDYPSTTRTSIIDSNRVSGVIHSGWNVLYYVPNILQPCCTIGLILDHRIPFPVPLRLLSHIETTDGLLIMITWINQPSYHTMTVNLCRSRRELVSCIHIRIIAHYVTLSCELRRRLTTAAHIALLVTQGSRDAKQSI